MRIQSQRKEIVPKDLSMGDFFELIMGMLLALTK